ncbi:MAG: homocysteine S-methyltransferase family protein [Saccharofermentanales bacterium]
MDRRSFKEFIAGGPVILDGASGTQMQELGMPAGVCPDLYAIGHPDMLKHFQRRYYEAGSDIVYSFTFGSNRTKLSHYGIDPARTADINKALAAISCEVRDEMRASQPDRSFYVAGGMAPTGEFLAPAGDLSFDELADIYREQATALEAGGADLFVVETMMDLAQTRAAVIAIREVSSLPVMATLTFDSGRTISGNTPEAALVTLESLGADAFGANCSTGPQEMLELLRNLRGISRLPLIAKPNAGMPETIGGKTVFPMGAKDFGPAAAGFAAVGVDLLGGCCGTTPEHIRELSARIRPASSGNLAAAADIPGHGDDYIASFCRVLKVDRQTSYAHLSCGDPQALSGLISDAADDGPDCIVVDLSAFDSATGFDPSDILDAFIMAGLSCKVPLGVITKSPSLLEGIARIYTGRLLYQSFEPMPSEISDITAKYGLLSVTL